MKSVSVIPIALLLAASATPTYGQGKESKPAEGMEAWEWRSELQLPEGARGSYRDLILTPGVFYRARGDLADLRLLDGSGKEVPYALRIRRPEDTRTPIAARLFNQVVNADHNAEVTLDLGAGAGEHNEIALATGGTDYRRRVRLEGSDAPGNWKTVLEGGVLVYFRAGNQVVDVHRLSYPPSRFRYLHVRVEADRGNPDDRPRIETVTVFRTVRLPGEEITLPARLGMREAVPGDGGPGSAWTIWFGQGQGETAPCEVLHFTLMDENFLRPYRLAVADPGEPPRTIASGQWRRTAGDKRPLEIRLPAEEMLGTLRLLVTDFRNPPLNLYPPVTYTGAARQVIFARGAELVEPLHLYYGNPNAQAPHYDFAASLPARIEPAPLRGTLGEASQNPTFHPLPKPWTERWPGLVYVLLGASSLVIVGILGLLAREALARSDAAIREGQPTPQP